MKKLFLAFLFILSTFTQAKTWDTSNLKYHVLGEQWLSRGAISILLQKRCETFMPKGTKCEKLGNDFYKALNIKTHKVKGKGGIPVVFTKKLIDLMYHPALKNYIMQLESNYETYETGFDLWQETLSFMGSKEKAIEIIAVVFQDISRTSAPILYLEEFIKKYKVSSIFKENFKVLKRFIEKIVSVNDLVNNSELERSSYKYYPREQYEMFSGSFYHFYTMAYASAVLRKRYKYNLKESLFMPFMLNFIYETINSSKVYAFVTPSKVKSQHQLLDIFSTYAGVLFGAEEEGKMVEFGVLGEIFAVDAGKAVEKVLVDL